MGRHSRRRSALPRWPWLAGGALLVVALLTAGTLLLVKGSGPHDGSPNYPSGGLTIATGGKGGVYYAYGTAYARELQRGLPGLRVRVVNTAGSVDNVKRLAAGEVQLAFMAADIASEVTDIEREAQALGRTTAIARVYDEYAHVVVPADSAIRTLADLRGKRVSTGAPDSSVEVTASRLLSAAGMDPFRDLRQERVGIAESAALLRAGRLDAFFWVGGLPTQAITELAAAVRIRLLPVGDHVDRMRARWGTFYRRASVPASMYATNEADTVAVPSYLVISAVLDADVVYHLTRLLFERRPRIAAEVPSGRLLDPRTAIATAPIPLHPGAARYYRDTKP